MGNSLCLTGGIGLCSAHLSSKVRASILTEKDPSTTKSQCHESCWCDSRETFESSCINSSSPFSQPLGSRLQPQFQTWLSSVQNTLEFTKHYLDVSNAKSLRNLSQSLKSPTQLSVQNLIDSPFPSFRRKEEAKGTSLFSRIVEMLIISSQGPLATAQASIIAIDIGDNTGLEAFWLCPKPPTPFAQQSKVLTMKTAYF